MEDILKKMPVCENCVHLILNDNEVKCGITGENTGLLLQCKDNYKNAYGLKQEEY